MTKGTHETGIVNIRGKEYHTVSKRVSDFREKFGLSHGITTEILGNDEIVTIRATITDRSDGFVVATGTAEERRGSSQINKTSALENAETSAIGRALAALGIGGTEFASADDVQRVQRPDLASGKAIAKINDLLAKTKTDAAKVCAAYKVESLDAMTATQAAAAIKRLEAK
jgi:hypothetical protein